MALSRNLREEPDPDDRLLDHDEEEFRAAIRMLRELNRVEPDVAVDYALFRMQFALYRKQLAEGREAETADEEEFEGQLAADSERLRAMVEEKRKNRGWTT